MWKRSDSEEAFTPQDTSHQHSPTRVSQTPAMIGTSILVKGEISGKENLLVEGRIEGTVRFPADTVVIGSNGSVQGDLYANIIQVRGQVVGDLFGNENVVVQQTGAVRGNITAPRVTLEDGAKLKGAIDMDPQTAPQTRSAAHQATNSTLDSTARTIEATAKNVESIDRAMKGNGQAAQEQGSASKTSGETSRQYPKPAAESVK